MRHAEFISASYKNDFKKILNQVQNDKKMKINPKQNLKSFDTASSTAEAMKDRQDGQSPEDIEEKLKQEFEEKKRKKSMQVSGASVKNIPKIQEKRLENEEKIA